MHTHGVKKVKVAAVQHDSFLLIQEFDLQKKWVTKNIWRDESKVFVEVRKLFEILVSKINVLSFEGSDKVMDYLLVHCWCIHTLQFSKLFKKNKENAYRLETGYIWLVFWPFSKPVKKSLSISLALIWASKDIRHGDPESWEKLCCQEPIVWVGSKRVLVNYFETHLYQLK